MALMARYERAPRADSGGPATPDGTPPKVTMRLGVDGTWQAVAPPQELIAEQEHRPAPPHPDDPRTGLHRNVGTYAAGS